MATLMPYSYYDNTVKSVRGIDFNLTKCVYQRRRNDSKRGEAQRSSHRNTIISFLFLLSSQSVTYSGICFVVCSITCLRGGGGGANVEEARASVP